MYIHNVQYMTLNICTCIRNRKLLYILYFAISLVPRLSGGRGKESLVTMHAYAPILPTKHGKQDKSPGSLKLRGGD